VVEAERALQRDGAGEGLNWARRPRKTLKSLCGGQDGSGRKLCAVISICALARPIISHG
jgi:hypothetical protein